jgi:chromosome segregation ATPase
MTDFCLYRKIISMTNPVPEHEKLFNDICNKLNELSTQGAEGEMTPAQPKYEQMQVQMKKFHSELVGSQEEFREKIKNLESVSYGPEILDAQSKQLADQLSAERFNNTKLSADLAKSLELSLQLQLEIQGLKARSMQIQNEDKKYSQAMFDKNRQLQKDLELLTAFRDELNMELAKAKMAFAKEHEAWNGQKAEFETRIQTLETEKQEQLEQFEELSAKFEDRENTIASLNEEIEKISTAYSEIEASAQQQSEVLRNLMSTAESKIVEMKLALDKKALEAQDYYSHLQQALTQFGVSKQENAAMKEYVTKLNYYHQQAQQAQMVVQHMAHAAATQAQTAQQVQQHQQQQVVTTP